jgi:glycosyltransferase involved in cell wall biosynthesis
MHPHTESATASTDPFDQTAYIRLLDRLEEHARQVAARMGIDWHATMVASPEQHSLHRQALTLLSLGLFDIRHYLETYPDIAVGGVDPLMHYVEHGDREGRWPNAHFDPQTYRCQFGTEGVGSVCALYHYAVVGEDLKLGSPTAFDPQRYLMSNPDLQSWLGRPMTHFLHLGKPAGLVLHHRIRLSRQQSVTIPPKAVLAIPEGISVDPGINVIGPLDRISGLGVSSRGYLEGLRLAGVTRIGTMARPLDFPRQSSVSEPLNLPPFIDEARINIVHMNADTLPTIMEQGGESLFRDRYNIAVWYWELPTLRPEWHVWMKHFHEFWAPTPFIADTLRRYTDKRVTLLPPYLTYLQHLRRNTASHSLPRSFVYCFDTNSVLERKNPGALLEAFQRACPINGPHKDVTLTLKITYPDHSVPEIQQLYKACHSDHRVRVIDRLLSDAELFELIGTATAYVSPHRSEGLGLTVVEAMAAGVPVITLPVGGPSCFISPDTALPVDYRLVELAKDHFPYPQGFVWADPDLDSLTENLRLALEHPEAAASRSLAARRQVMDHFCSPHLIKLYRAQMQRLSMLKQHH